MAKRTDEERTEARARRQLLRDQKRFLETSALERGQQVRAEMETVLSRKASKRRARKRARAQPKAKRPKRSQKAAEVPRDIIRPYPQGWRVATAKAPMTPKEYVRYLETPHWQEFRERYRTSDRLQECFVCGDENFELHHHTYVRLGREELADVVPLCEEHHYAVHKAVKAGVGLANAHTYVKMRYQRGELELRTDRCQPNDPTIVGVKTHDGAARVDGL